jgi:hypothetical protein
MAEVEMLLVASVDDPGGKTILLRSRDLAPHGEPGIVRWHFPWIQPGPRSIQSNPDPGQSGYTSAIMVEELFAKLRGVKNWPETTATVYSISRYEVVTGKYGGTSPAADVTFSYRGEDREIQSGFFTVDSGCSLYNVEENDTFSVQYDPKHPERFYCSEYGFPYWRKFNVVGYVVAAAVLVYLLIRSRFHL